LCQLNVVYMVGCQDAEAWLSCQLTCKFTCWLVRQSQCLPSRRGRRPELQQKIHSGSCHMFIWSYIYCTICCYCLLLCSLCTETYFCFIIDCSRCLVWNKLICGLSLLNLDLVAWLCCITLMLLFDSVVEFTSMLHCWLLLQLCLCLLELWISFRPHCMHGLQRCSLSLQM